MSVSRMLTDLQDMLISPVRKTGLSTMAIMSTFSFAW